MNRRRVLLPLAALTLALVLTPQARGSAGLAPLAATALGTAFTYQGQLKQNGQPVNGTCDFQFSLFDAASAGVQIGSTQTVSSVAVTNGLFTVTLDFGPSAFNGDSRWLQVAPGCPAPAGSFTALSPRQAVSPAPYAVGLPGLFTQQNATSPNLIGGFNGNSVTAGVVGATIGGGGKSGGANRVTDDYGTVGGGFNNRAGDAAGTTSDSPNATVGGGQSNTASNFLTTVGGGFSNTASGFEATVGGGGQNMATGSDATVGGGVNNTASGDVATVAGGNLNMAQGMGSFAAGRFAQALHDGAFVWNDGNGGSNFLSTAANQFLMRATGNVGINTNAPAAGLEVHRNGGTSQFLIGKFKNDATTGDLTTVVDLENGGNTPTLWRLGVGGSGNGLGLTAGQLYLERSGIGARLVVDASGNFTLSPSSGSCSLTSGGVGWSCSSDRALKDHVQAVDPRAVLAQLRQVPISRWTVRDAETPHLGPMAQDFYAAFGLGDDAEHINTVDAQGVALAAVQGLHQLVAEKDAQVAALAQQHAAQQDEITALQAQLAAQGAELAALKTEQAARQQALAARLTALERAVAP